ncbi:ubiquitin elongating factor core-domain-containing protein [Fomitopsis serialis]|uniref:ubiquitin elongating factor core-domain-containing protein n=1 Tax=Fomitopsis serialis TaxID=139415 RepID=UPI0020077B34|nr:ubiquitin elongating factor core-domain-containing protein [Neoantrodia serialis]KAH9936359.1 ubiquitin elongating factor core-domain-containing protein [Neoantrodia serialis]
MTNPQDDADRIRLKRLAKLQSASPSPAASTSTTPPPSTLPPALAPPKPRPVQQSAPKRPAEAAPAQVAPKKRPQAAPAHLDLPAWEDETVARVFNVTLRKDVAEQSGWEVVWLKHLAAELESEGMQQPIRLSGDIVDRLLISRLELDPQSMSDDLEYLAVIASLPPQQTVFEYLVGCWKRLNASRSAFLKKNYTPVQSQQVIDILEKLRDLIISYAGLTLQEPEMFPQPTGKPLGPSELVAPLLSLSALSGPLLSSSATSTDTLGPSEVDPFLQDLVKRFEPDNEIDGVLEPVVNQLCFHESLFRPEGLGGGDGSWRAVISGLEALVNIKSIAVMITRLQFWNPEATPPTFERVSLLGPLLRLGVFDKEWPTIANTYYSKSKDRSQADIASSTASLRGTLKSLQSSLFNIFNALVRASPDSREAVLQYFARVVALNVRRAGMQVDPDTVASDCFMVNLQAIMLRFCDPFMDANYTKIDRIDTAYYAHSSRIDLKEETRINAASEESEQWRQKNEATATPPTFISDIFYLTLAVNHYGYQKTISTFEDLARQYDEMNRHLEMLEGDGSWRGSPLQARVEHSLNAVKTEMDKVMASQLAYTVQLSDPELVFRSISFTNFVSTWLIRHVDPRHTHPNPPVELPLPREVPESFRVLPEYIIEDIVDYHLFVVRQSPDSLELSGKNELLIWALTFLTSTWYIKNPFLKSKLVEALFYATLNWGNQRSVLAMTMNTHPMALKYLVPALTNFYIEVEQTGASSQFYDKFNSRRNIAYLFKAIWNNPTHREALKKETRTNMEKFVRFVNLMINDVTYLMDESLSDLAKIHEIQTEMEDTETFNAQPAQHRRERESALRTLERHTSGYVQLGRSTVEMLKAFTGEVKEPFMVPEIVDRLAAMLDYNLDALAGPRCQNLVVKNPEKYKFNPKQLLSDIIDVYLNLSDQGEFVRAVAADGRSYRKELFERTAGIAKRRVLKSDTEIEKLLMFVVKVEEKKATLEAEEDLGEVPEEFLDPLMYTVMRDPVTLPSSRVVVDRSTIKSHLLSDAKDPFNRVPLVLEDVISNLELKQRIDAFLSDRRNKHTALDKPVEEIVKMDETA